jgi:hypothetical protein
MIYDASPIAGAARMLEFLAYEEANRLGDLQLTHGSIPSRPDEAIVLRIQPVASR